VLRRSSEDTVRPPAQLDICVRLSRHRRVRLEFQTSLVPFLARHHRVLVFDRPGYGYSERGDGPWPDPAALARLLLDASEQLGAPRPLLVGHSWGGAVVMSALLREPQRIAGGVLLAGVAGHWVGEKDLVEQLRDWPLLNSIFAHTLVYPVGSLLLPGVLEEVFAPHPVPPGHASRVGAALALRPHSYLHNARDMNRLSEYLQRESSRYAEITGNLLVIHGTADTLVPFWNHGKRLLPVIDGIQVALLQGYGHAPHHVDPERVAGLIHDFAHTNAHRTGGVAASDGHAVFEDDALPGSAAKPGPAGVTPPDLAACPRSAIPDRRSLLCHIPAVGDCAASVSSRPAASSPMHSSSCHGRRRKPSSTWRSSIATNGRQ